MGRELIDAVFSFMVMDLAKAEAVHLYSTDDSYTASRQKAFIAAAYDKKTGRVHVTLSVNPSADQPDAARLLSGSLSAPQCTRSHIFVEVVALRSVLRV